MKNINKASEIISWQNFILSVFLNKFLENKMNIDFLKEPLSRAVEEGRLVEEFLSTLYLQGDEKELNRILRTGASTN